MIVLKTHTYGGRAWVARITGPDPKYKLAREFVAKRDVTTASSNVYRDLEFYIQAKNGEYYEYRNFESSSRGGKSGFWKVVNGELVDVTIAEVLNEFAAV